MFHDTPRMAHSRRAAEHSAENYIGRVASTLGQSEILRQLLAAPAGRVSWVVSNVAQIHVVGERLEV